MRLFLWIALFFGCSGGLVDAMLDGDAVRAALVGVLFLIGAVALLGRKEA